MMLPSDFGHFLAAKLQHAVMDPVAGKLLTGVRLALGNLILVMREDQVVAAP